MKSYTEKHKRSRARYREWEKTVKKMTGAKNKKYFLFDDATERYISVGDSRWRFKDFRLMSDKVDATAYSMGFWSYFLADFGKMGRFRPIAK